MLPMILLNVLSTKVMKNLMTYKQVLLASDWLSSLTDGSRLHWGIVVAIIIAIVMWFLLDRTTLGYELKSVGFNQNASQYAGMKVSRNVVLSMTIAGAFAGIGGAMEGLGTFQSMTAMSSFTGIDLMGLR